MKKYEEKLSTDALLLDRYLSQYKRCIRRKRALEQRRNNIIQEFDYPVKAVVYTGMPHGSGENQGCAALSMRLDEINERIEEQIEKSVKLLAEIMNVIEFLPENTVERVVIEHRYIDRMGWGKICDAAYISRTTAFKHWKKGLYKLLEFKKIQQNIEKYSKEIENN